MKTEETSIKGRKRDLDAFIAWPESAPAKAPAVIVIHEIFGLDGHIRDVAQRFAREGYVGVAPNLFTGEVQRLLTPANIALAMQSFAQAPPDLRKDPSKFAAFAASQPPERRPVLEAFAKVSNPQVQAGFGEDLHDVADHVRALPGVHPQRVGSVGFCFGGAMSARLATLDPALRAAVIFYGQNPPLDAVPNVRAKVLGLYGGEDHGITDSVPELEAAMKKAGQHFEYHVYPGARHAFFNDTRPQVYHEESAKDAWKRVLSFYGKYLQA
jgi:carboxymethylenebutenolidase